ncbi:alpha/beta hydrolase [Cupriavidus sp. USMAA2-4]|uniref:alpha/beta fold hydrolase n=1 Tax=Cupriavidus sp. USMAA2-4 TaxID=876364 RepID=UPI0008A66AE7|nr:alpha/beta hydrolase [Cupriavidus sp. USMAA2-4]AOY94405.1 alpha/beta hydrolase [Cupriavidus sp. USMAA2-4]
MTALPPRAATPPLLLRHHRLHLALHTLKPGPGPALLLLHGLGEASPGALPPGYAAWPGAVHALDFTGHGKSDLPRGGGYSCEHLMADADIALAHLGSATLAGRGLGGYVGLMLAGARPALVRGVLVLDGPGLAGGVAVDSNPHIPVVDTARRGAPDPYAIADLATEMRPPRYAVNYARLAAQHAAQQSAQQAAPVPPLAVCCREHPEWLLAVMAELGLAPTPLTEALATYAAHAAQAVPPTAPGSAGGAGGAGARA